VTLPDEPPHAEGGEGQGSGLRDPQRAIRGLGALTLVLEAIVLLLAIAPLRMLQHGIPAVQLWVVLGAAVAALVIAGMLGREAGWRVGTALQAALVLGGTVHWTIGAIGVTFGLAWYYVLYVRRRVLS
jgi:hypothetical protein